MAQAAKQSGCDAFIRKLDNGYDTEMCIRDSDNGTYSNDANKYAANLSSPAEYVINNSAQSFLTIRSSVRVDMGIPIPER